MRRQIYYRFMVHYQKGFKMDRSWKYCFCWIAGIAFLTMACTLDEHFISNNEDFPAVITLEDEQKSPYAKIQDVAWIAGQWEADAFGGVSEEVWNPPFGPSMVGMYKLVKDNKVVFYELLVIMEHLDSLILKLKHFNPDLTGWEEKAQTVDFPLVKLTADSAYFDGLTFRRIDENTMKIFLLMKKKGGQSHEEIFILRRVD